MFFKKLLYLTALSILFVACGKNGYIIKGDIIDLDEGTISLLDVYGHTISSTEVVDGKFTLEGKVDVPCLAYINNALGVVYPVDIPVLLENTVINVNGDARAYRHHRNEGQRRHGRIQGPEGCTIPQ